MESKNKATNENKTRVTSYISRQNNIMYFQSILPGHTPVIQTFFSWENDPQSPSQILWMEAHDL